MALALVLVLALGLGLVALRLGLEPELAREKARGVDLMKSKM